jgi:predicted secreted protein
MADENSIPAWWIVLFLLLALGLGAAAVFAVGGSLLAGIALPTPLVLH